MEKIAECQKSTNLLQVEADVYPLVYENLARQRYNTEQLGKFLEDKRKALREGDCQLADRLESGIARLAESIALLRDDLLPLLDGRTVSDFSASFPEHMRAPLAGLTAEMSRLEWLCLKELNGIRQILQKRMDFENIHPLGKDLSANPCREIAARRTRFTVQRQSQAQNT